MTNVLDRLMPTVVKEIMEGNMYERWLEHIRRGKKDSKEISNVILQLDFRPRNTRWAKQLLLDD
jgi:hypothetical protein